MERVSAMSSDLQLLQAEVEDRPGDVLVRRAYADELESCSDRLNAAWHRLVAKLHECGHKYADTDREITELCDALQSGGWNLTSNYLRLHQEIPKTHHSKSRRDLADALWGCIPIAIGFLSRGLPWDDLPRRITFEGFNWMAPGGGDCRIDFVHGLPRRLVCSWDAWKSQHRKLLFEFPINTVALSTPPTFRGTRVHGGHGSHQIETRLSLIGVPNPRELLVDTTKRRCPIREVGGLGLWPELERPTMRKLLELQWPSVPNWAIP